MPKLKTIKVIGAVLMIPALFAGTVALHYLAPSSEVNTRKPSDNVSRINSSPSTATDDSKLTTNAPQERQSSKPVNNGSSTTSSSTRQPTVNSNTPQVTPYSNSQGQSVVHTPAACNESMKTAYTNYYDSQVAAENSRWTNQVNAWAVDANSRGMAFSGYVQDMINKNKPAHNSRLAQLQVQYQQNLTSINCGV